MKTRAKSPDPHYHKIRWEDLFDETRASSERTNPDYVENVDRRNLVIYLELQSAALRSDFLTHLPAEERRSLRKELSRIETVQFATLEDLVAARRSNKETALRVTQVTATMIKYLAKQPDKIRSLSPRQFEELIAEILKDMGCEVELTKQTRDGGRDILAIIKTQIGKLLTIVECKRFRLGKPVGTDIVERFLYTINEKDRASHGIIATTSHFSSGAIATAREFKYRLQLRDFVGIKEWLSNYGNWVRESNSALWIPRH